MADESHEVPSTIEPEFEKAVRDTQATRINTELGEVLSGILRASGTEVTGEKYDLNQTLGGWDYECSRFFKDGGLILTTSITRTAPKDGRVLVEMYDVDSRLPQPPPQPSSEGTMKQTMTTRPSKIEVIAGGKPPSEDRQSTVNDFNGLIAELRTYAEPKPTVVSPTGGFRRILGRFLPKKAA